MITNRWNPRLAVLLAAFVSATVLQVAGAPSSLAVYTAKQVSTGDSHTCVVTTGGRVLCWGNNDFGQLGDGTKKSHNRPAQVKGLTSGVTQVASGGTFSCALMDTGRVKCWGANARGQLGDGTFSARLSPVRVQGIAGGVTQVSAGADFVCAVFSSGGLRCWGANAYGQLGDGTRTRRSKPVQVLGLTSGVRQVSAGGYGHTCVTTNAGKALCWGNNDFGQLGTGNREDKIRPAVVSGFSSGATRISAGYLHTCVVTSAANVKCWGYNDQGQLGDGSRSDSYFPVLVLDIGQVQKISAGSYHTCAVDTVKSTWCWGSGAAGQMGDGTRDTYRLTPTTSVSGLSGSTKKMTTGGSFSCAVKSSGILKCWGVNNWGQLGDGTRTIRTKPVTVYGF